MKKKIDTKTAMELCKKHNVEYINHEIKKDEVKNKNETYIQFVCYKHEKYGVQERKAYDLKRLNKICVYCNHRKLKETFKDEMVKINPNIEVLSEYINWDTPLKCRCKIDGYEWNGSPSVLLYGGGCKICGYTKIWDTRGRRTTDDFKKIMYDKNPNIKIIGDYNGSHEYIKCKCTIDGKEWESITSNILNGTAGCPECRARMIKERDGMGHENFCKRLYEINPYVEVIDEYINYHTPITFLCKKHDIKYQATPSSFLSKDSNPCPMCVNYKGEVKMLKLLNNNHINFKSQHTFDDCKYINKLKFDAYDLDNNIAYEYQGRQHYEPVDFTGRGYDYAIEQFKIGQIRDNIKREYCNKHGIKLIEIPYWDYDDMEKYIQIA